MSREQERKKRADRLAAILSESAPDISEQLARHLTPDQRILVAEALHRRRRAKFTCIDGGRSAAGAIVAIVAAALTGLKVAKVKGAAVAAVTSAAVATAAGIAATPMILEPAPPPVTTPVTPGKKPDEASGDDSEVDAQWVAEIPQIDHPMKVSRQPSSIPGPASPTATVSATPTPTVVATLTPTSTPTVGPPKPTASPRQIPRLPAPLPTLTVLPEVPTASPTAVPVPGQIPLPTPLPTLTVRPLPLPTLTPLPWPTVRVPSPAPTVVQLPTLPHRRPDGGAKARLPTRACDHGAPWAC